MNIGIFTDTYYPQVSGVATSIKTLRRQLERLGHTVYVFTTTDPNVEKNVYEPNIFRFSSVPFISFTDRRIAVRGVFQALQVARELNLDIVHTQTEFSLGLIGKFVAKNLKIPCVHTYHTMYEDYLHYVAKGKLLRPVHVKQMSRSFCQNMSGIVAPSERVLNTLTRYGITAPISVIPTGVDIARFSKKHNTQELRVKLGLQPNQPVLLTLSRLAFEKDIDKLIAIMPQVFQKITDARLVIVGDGPARQMLEDQVAKLKIADQVIFTGEINNDDVVYYYQMADLFVSTSVSESQGLTYIEALASGLPVLATHSPYTDQLLDDLTLGKTFAQPDELVADIYQYLAYDKEYFASSYRKDKLHAISATRFGEAIVDFYDDSMLFYEKHIAGKEPDQIS
ncbi:glycosyltransferase [Ligilactobacillus saerimneri]|uniref:Glycosyltransferase n=1 Tax=Ligilactobacillus saerimneri TaxID=228229 RepID=A0A7H9EKM6_9LACO|nr:glycosyltransferase family 4 protein [Ligilactobacillus saerimneri]QLL78273.1 glycosyltransferase [Ligilactobacillus saerimneri]